MASIFFADEPVTLDNGLRGVPWQVETANPASFFELLSGSGPSPTTQIYAQTFLPSAVRNPPAVKLGSKMPSYDLTEEEVDALTAYLLSLT